MKTLKELGYSVGPDAFMQCLDKNTGKAIAVIYDFGTIFKKRKKQER